MGAPVLCYIRHSVYEANGAANTDDDRSVCHTNFATTASGAGARRRQCFRRWIYSTTTNHRLTNKQQNMPTVAQLLHAARFVSSPCVTLRPPTRKMTKPKKSTAATTAKLRATLTDIRIRFACVPTFDVVAIHDERPHIQRWLRSLAQLVNAMHATPA
jgi:hypothetical protein